MPPIIVLAAGAFTAGAIVHRLIKEVRRINAELVGTPKKNCSFLSPRPHQLGVLTF